MLGVTLWLLLSTVVEISYYYFVCLILTFEFFYRKYTKNTDMAQWILLLQGLQGDYNFCLSIGTRGSVD